MKKILVLGGNDLNKPIFSQLNDAGFFSVCADRSPGSPAAQIASSFFPVDITDVHGITRLSRDCGIDGIMPINEYGVKTAAIVAEELGLVSCIPPERAAFATDKGLMRQVWERSCVPQPRFSTFESIEELRVATVEIGYPCVVKPRESGGGGRGISVVCSEDEIEWAFRYASQFRRGSDRPFVVEEFMDGLEVTVESIVQDGIVTHLTMSDKVKPPLRTRVASSLNYPAAVPDAVRRGIETVTTSAIRAIGIRNGMAHSELIVTDQGPKMVELGARGGGGHIFHTIIEAVTGLRAPVATAHILTGDRFSIDGLSQMGAVYRFFTPSRGILREVRQFDIAQLTEGVLDIGLLKRIGEEVGLNYNSMDRTGYVVTRGRTRADAIKTADKVENIIEFVME